MTLSPSAVVASVLFVKRMAPLTVRLPNVGSSPALAPKKILSMGHRLQMVRPSACSGHAAPSSDVIYFQPLRDRTHPDLVRHAVSMRSLSGHPNLAIPRRKLACRPVPTTGSANYLGQEPSDLCFRVPRRNYRQRIRREWRETVQVYRAHRSPFHQQPHLQ